MCHANLFNTSTATWNLAPCNTSLTSAVASYSYTQAHIRHPLGATLENRSVQLHCLLPLPSQCLGHVALVLPAECIADKVACFKQLGQLHTVLDA